MGNFDPTIELQRAFELALENITAVVPFDPTWANGTGYFDGAVDGLKLSIGEVVKSTCPTGRRLIIVGTVLGNVIVFERKAPGVGRFMLTYNSHEALNLMLGGSALTLAQFHMVVTSWDVNENIGTYLDNMYNTMVKCVRKMVNAGVEMVKGLPKDQLDDFMHNKV